MVGGRVGGRAGGAGWAGGFISSVRRLRLVAGRGRGACPSAPTHRLFTPPAPARLSPTLPCRQVWGDHDDNFKQLNSQVGGGGRGWGTGAGASRRHERQVSSLGRWRPLLSGCTPYPPPRLCSCGASVMRSTGEAQQLAAWQVGQQHAAAVAVVAAAVVAAAACLQKSLCPADGSCARIHLHPSLGPPPRRRRVWGQPAVQAAARNGNGGDRSCVRPDAAPAGGQRRGGLPAGRRPAGSGGSGAAASRGGGRRRKRCGRRSWQ